MQNTPAYVRCIVSYYAMMILLDRTKLSGARSSLSRNIYDGRGDSTTLREAQIYEPGRHHRTGTTHPKYLMGTADSSADRHLLQAHSPRDATTGQRGQRLW